MNLRICSTAFMCLVLIALLFTIAIHSYTSIIHFQPIPTVNNMCTLKGFCNQENDKIHPDGYEEKIRK